MKINYKLLLILSVMALITIGGVISYRWLFGDLPDPSSISAHLNTPSVRITDRYGQLLYEILPRTGGRHTVVALDSIPILLQQATIATEDKGFYKNPGVDWHGILRAVWTNVRGGETLSGGSTITQQVARNLLLSQDERNERSVRRKLRESLLAWQLTNRFTKNEILALYLNQIYYGGMAYGIEAASQTFFGKPTIELDLAECALLAGLPQAPSLYNPYTHPEAAKQRQVVVLKLMEKEGYITPEQRTLAETEPLIYTTTPYPIEAPHFDMMVRAQLDQLISPDDIISHGGVVVKTTLDLDWQRIAENAVIKQVEALKKENEGLGHNVNSAALVALNPETGEILSMVGSPDFFDADNGGAINMALTPRQPGSSIKPILYAAAIDPTRPLPWTPATMILDVRTSFVTHDGQSYTPVNYDRQEHGPVLLRQALASSLNIPAVITLNHIGLPDLFTLASDLGITTLGDPNNHDLSLALGGGDVSLLELTAAYATFANGGFRLNPYTILEIDDPQGNILYKAEAAPKARILDERVVWLISDILSDNDARMLGFGPNSILKLDRPAAVKTGTTTNFHDNWTVGYTPDLVVSVWVGNTNHEPMWEITGLTGAAPIWHQFLRTVLTGISEKPFKRPPGMVQVDICALSGLLPTEACPYRRWEWFIEGTQPTKPDTIYKVVTIDSITGRLADSTTPDDRRITQTVLDLPPQVEPWARIQGFLLYSDILARTTEHLPLSGSPSSLPLQIVSPAPNTIFRRTSNLDPSTQKLHLEAVGKADLHDVTLYIDGIALASFKYRPYETWWPLTVGMHQVWAEAITSNGDKVMSEKISFEVKGE